MVEIIASSEFYRHFVWFSGGKLFANTLQRKAMCIFRRAVFIAPSFYYPDSDCDRFYQIELDEEADLALACAITNQLFYYVTAVVTFQNSLSLKL